MDVEVDELTHGRFGRQDTRTFTLSDAGDPCRAFRKELRSHAARAISFLPRTLRRSAQLL